MYLLIKLRAMKDEELSGLCIDCLRMDSSNGKVLIKRIREGIEGVNCDEQCGFRREIGCIDQTFAVRQVCDTY